jgi:hypothetical protein
MGPSVAFRTFDDRDFVAYVDAAGGRLRYFEAVAPARVASIALAAGAVVGVAYDWRSDAFIALSADGALAFYRPAPP